MNNGRPPYGDSSQWGQQPPAGQDPSAQFVPGQYPQQGAYQQPGQSQPYQTYQPQSRQPQEGYQQQSWQPYGQQDARQGYPQSYQQGYPQGYPQAAPQQYSQGYPQMPQQYSQGYPQMTPQGYSQSYQQPVQQGYPQGYPQGVPQGYPQQGGQPLYQQSVQNGQPLQQGMPQGGQPQGGQPGVPQGGVQPGQFVPSSGYSGYVTQPGGSEPASPFSAEVIVKVVLFGLLPVLFVLGLLLKSPALCWVFLAAAAGTMVFVWLQRVIDDKLRLISSIVVGGMAIVALVTALNGPGKQQETEGNAGPAANAAQSGAQATGMLTWEATPVPPTPTPALTADVAGAGEAEEVLQSFFYFWHVNNDESMLALTAPSWRNAQEDPLKALFTIRANRTPQDDLQIFEISGSEADTTRNARVRVTISKNISGRQPDVLAFDVMLRKEDGQWYIDPQSLTSNEVVSTTKATNPMATQPPLNTATATTVLYYNPDGGSYYHFDQYCGKINERYLPLQGQFLYSQLNDEPYCDLDNCTYCGAPLRNP